MSGIGAVYGEALYAIAREEGLGDVILGQLNVLGDSFAAEPDFLRLLSASSLPKAERCRILDDCFRDKVEAYVLNFLKILMEKSCLRHFPACIKAYRAHYDRDNGILRVTAVTAVSLTDKQRKLLTGKLRRITGRQIVLVNRLDPGILGGIRLDYGGKRLEDTLAHRMDAIGKLLHSTRKAGTLWN